MTPCKTETKTEISCPNCHCTDFISVCDEGFIINDSGLMQMHVCLDCGTIYLDQETLTHLKEHREKRRQHLNKSK